jgi:hypothetical protein
MSTQKIALKLLRACFGLFGVSGAEFDAQVRRVETMSPAEQKRERDMLALQLWRAERSPTAPLHLYLVTWQAEAGAVHRARVRGVSIQDALDGWQLLHDGELVQSVELLVK